jgi:hypothetical protein
VWTINDAGAWVSSSQIFSPLKNLTHKNSYLISMNKTCTLIIEGTLPASTEISLSSEKWNTPGWPSYKTENFELYKLSNFTIWTTQNGIWKSNKDIYGPITAFNPTYGYMIYSNSNMTINITN